MDRRTVSRKEEKVLLRKPSEIPITKMATCPLRIQEHCGRNRRCGAEIKIGSGGHGKNCFLSLVHFCGRRGRPRLTKEVKMIHQFSCLQWTSISSFCIEEANTIGVKKLLFVGNIFWGKMKTCLCPFNYLQCFCWENCTQKLSPKSCPQ